MLIAKSPAEAFQNTFSGNDIDATHLSLNTSPREEPTFIFFVDSVVFHKRVATRQMNASCVMSVVCFYATCFLSATAGREVFFTFLWVVLPDRYSSSLND